MPIISAVQQNQASTYSTMTTIATFFSGVIATTLQSTYNQTATVLDNVVNAFLSSSIIFSIGSAVNNLLVMSWKRSFMYVYPFLELKQPLIGGKDGPLMIILLSLTA